jgi:hypothetical protein
VVASVAAAAILVVLCQRIRRTTNFRDAEGSRGPQIASLTIPIPANGSQASVTSMERRPLCVLSSSSCAGPNSRTSEVVIVGPDPARELLWAQQGWMLEKATTRRLTQTPIDMTTDAGGPGAVNARSGPVDDGEAEVLRAQVSMLQRQMEEMRASQGVALDVGDLAPPAYEGSISGRS